MQRKDLRSQPVQPVEIIEDFTIDEEEDSEVEVVPFFRAPPSPRFTAARQVFSRVPPLHHEGQFTISGCLFWFIIVVFLANVCASMTHPSQEQTGSGSSISSDEADKPTPPSKKTKRSTRSRSE